MDLNKHFDLDTMLYEDAIWLSGRTVLPKGQFLDIASKMDLRQQDWDTFWKRVRIMKYDEEPNIKCVIYGKRWKLNTESFEVAKDLIGEPSGEISSCCGRAVYSHNENTHTSKCMSCNRDCDVIYVWGGKYEIF